MEGYPAGRVLPGRHQDDAGDLELRIAFDFDAVVIDDEPERVFESGGLKEFHESERQQAQTPHTPGPLCDLLTNPALDAAMCLTPANATQVLIERQQRALGEAE